MSRDYRSEARRTPISELIARLSVLAVEAADPDNEYYPSQDDEYQAIADEIDARIQGRP